MDKLNYGFCPECGADVVSRERHINGDSTCDRNHKFPSRKTVPYDEGQWTFGEDGSLKWNPEGMPGQSPPPRIDWLKEKEIMDDLFKKLKDLKNNEN